MKLCAAQIKSEKGQITANILKHEAVTLTAAAQGAQLIVFPELSITGYEPSMARQLASTYEDLKFNELQEISNKNNIAICFGFPIRTENLPLIGMIIISSGQPRQLYCKQHLHSDEIQDFSFRKDNLILNFPEIKIAPAICYESLLVEHADNAFQEGANFYLASVAKPQRGIELAYRHMPSIAQKYSFPVLMANAVGPSDNFVSSGGSAAWNNKGHLLAKLDTSDEGLLIYDTSTHQVQTVKL